MKVLCEDPATKQSLELVLLPILYDEDEQVGGGDLISSVLFWMNEFQRLGRCLLFNVRPVIFLSKLCNKCGMWLLCPLGNQSLRSDPSWKATLKFDQSHRVFLAPGTYAAYILISVYFSSIVFTRSFTLMPVMR